MKVSPNIITQCTLCLNRSTERCYYWSSNCYSIPCVIQLSVASSSVPKFFGQSHYKWKWRFHVKFKVFRYYSFYFDPIIHYCDFCIGSFVDISASWRDRIHSHMLYSSGIILLQVFPEHAGGKRFLYSCRSIGCWINWAGIHRDVYFHYEYLLWHSIKPLKIYILTILYSFYTGLTALIRCLCQGMISS